MAPQLVDRVCSSSRELAITAMKIMGGKELDAPDKTEIRSLAIIPPTKSHNGQNKFLGMFRTIFQFFRLGFPIAPSVCPSLGSLVTGTLFGFRKGRVHFAVQEDPKSTPVLLLELATPTNALVKEMASGLVRIALECERTPARGNLFQESVWTMYCNGRKTGYAIRRVCSTTEVKILTLVQAISIGAGVLPMEERSEEELLYMRAKFERVVGSRDSEAFYMMNPDGTGGPELSIFLLRI